MKHLALLFVTVFLIGCTSSLWKKPSYVENVVGYYFIKEKNLLLIEGKKYSYIIEAQPLLEQTLLTSRSINLVPTFTEFELDASNHISGNLNLTSFDDENKDKLAPLGFVKSKSGTLERNFSISGQRYEVKGDFPFQKLEGDHRLQVSIPEAHIRKLGKIIATPATLAIDAVGVVAIGSVFALAGIANGIDHM
ncbi:hypothetical protein SOPP22_13810 [Shewanella sp. OPT22]|nr:hypothetical protein SOPP22_13810 [Shewanella sp. OPT22]